MPSVEQYGAQPPIELLRQFQDFKGFYDRKKLFWKDIVDTTLVCSAAPPGGGRNGLTPRFTRHFHMLCLPPTSEDSMTLIFGSILEGFLGNFKHELQQMKNAIVASTIEVYNRISKELLPTPARSHYTFNLRDVSKVFQGILMVRPHSVPSEDSLARLWIHETMRVFHDRLINNEDKLWMTETIIKLLGFYFRIPWTHADVFQNRSPIMWVDCLRPGMGFEERQYEEVKDYNKFVKIMEDYLEEYNSTHSSQMNLVFFQDAMEHVARISRVLRQPRGNAMLVGVGGSGKQSLTRLATYFSEFTQFQIELVKGYDITMFREDLKKIMRSAGVDGQHTVFLFTDSQIIDETFLEDVNNILNAGEVPNLFPSDEVDKIVEDLRPVAKEKGVIETKDNIYNFFVSRVREFLHIVLCMSPVGDALRVRMRMFPSLVNCCTIDWFMPWPEEALLSVSRKFLAHLDVPKEEVRTALATMCVTIHTSVKNISEVFFQRLRRYVYTTPKSYLDLISSYLHMLEEKRELKNRLKRRLEIGLKKLEETNVEVQNMQQELTKLEPILDQKAIETEQLLKKVALDRVEADKVRVVVEEEERIVKEQAAQVEAVQSEAQRDLDEAMPALNKALAALDSLNKNDINEIKSFPKPPALVMLTMEVVNLLLGEKQDWDTAKRVLSDTSFLNRLKTFDKDNIPQPILKKLRKYTENPEYSDANVGKVSTAARSLCMWTHAMDLYSRVAKEVEPKRQRLAEMNKQLDDANTMLKGKQDQLQAVLDKVAALQRELDETMAEKERLVREAKLTADRLSRAGKLTSGLVDEQIRWKETVEIFKQEIEALVGDVFLSAACISYYGPFTGDYRDMLVSQWVQKCIALDVPVSDRFSLEKTMGDPVQIRDWNIQGLPTDSVSVNNGILVTRGRRWPLMIDPQAQANRWIKHMESNGISGLKITKFSEGNLLRTLENCIRMGVPLLIEDIGESLDPALEPVLLKAVFNLNGRNLIHLGDSDVDYDSNFRFYMTTKLPNPHYTPEISAKTTVVNFTVTIQGLEDQLLGRVILIEKRELEDQRVKLLEEVNMYKKRGKELEEFLLARLSNAEGDLLDDVELIDVLNDTKKTAEEIAEKIANATVTEENINVAREEFRPVAARGSILYFLVADMSNVNTMYQTSLAQFLSKFDEALNQSEKSLVTAKRIVNIIEYSTLYIFQYVSRGLFESHKMVFLLLMTLKIDMHARRITPLDFNAFIKAGAALDVNTVRKNPTGWIPTDAWLNLVALTQITTFSNILDQIGRNEKAWKTWYDSEAPEEHTIPEGYDTQLDAFGRLLLVRCFRPDRTMLAAVRYVSQMGDAFVNPKNIELMDILTESTPRTPILFLLSAGSDPTESIYALGKKMKTVPNGVSMGQGQEIIARELISKALVDGGWVLLQNCHLGIKFLSELENTLATLEPGTENPDFRVWITAEPHPKFPIGLLQMSIKLTNEPPQGVKAGLRRSYAWLTQDKLEVIDRGQWRQILYAMCFLHTCVQERRKYGPLGWNIPYEFNQSDLSASVQFLQKFLYNADPKKPITWSTIRYMICEVMYGGRITDDLDRVLMNTYGQVWMDNHLFSPDYCFYPGYVVPDKTRIDDYRHFIESLPFVDTPEIMGLHSNADITYRQNESAKVLSVILSIQPKDGGGAGGETREDAVLRIVEDLLSKLPKDFDKNVVASQIKNQGGFLPLNIFLKQEIDRMQVVITLLRRNLQDLKLAIAGTIIMSETLAEVLNALYDARVPKTWEAKSWPSKTLGYWFADVVRRSEQYSTWLEEGRPKVFWLTGFFNPQGFLTAMRQETTRANKGWSLDSVVLNTEVTKLEREEVRTRPEDGVYIYGLFLEGAGWDKKNSRLVESAPKVLNAPLPVVHITATNVPKKVSELYLCPVYKTPKRTDMNFIFSVTLPSPQPPSHWTLRGVALLCSTV
eukprot:GILI01004106.1.p1 GENE.GILI01004106.1~~GILI01004106.1.p1  ORF type:complete len:1989 (+),score=654.53 GILI01004106.1:157-5967(+)